MFIYAVDNQLLNMFARGRRPSQPKFNQKKKSGGGFSLMLIALFVSIAMNLIQFFVNNQYLADQRMQYPAFNLLIIIL